MKNLLFTGYEKHLKIIKTPCEMVLYKILFDVSLLNVIRLSFNSGKESSSGNATINQPRGRFCCAFLIDVEYVFAYMPGRLSL